VAEPAAATKFHFEPDSAGPEAAGFIAMPKALELGRLPRLIEHVIFVVGCLADFVWYKGTPLGILGTSHGLTDALEFLLIVKIAGVLVGLALQFR
jgi:hypothetical protein